jgi:hypothetical protein
MARSLPPLLLVFTLCVHTSLYAQQKDSALFDTFDLDSLKRAYKQRPFSLSRDARAFTGFEYINKESWGLRAYFGLGSDWIQVSPFTTTVMYDKNEEKIKVSANSLALIPLMGVGATFNPHGGGGPDWLLVTCAILTLPQVLPNITITAPIIKDHFYLGAGQRTDYYLFNSVAKIYTESSAVARVFVHRFGAEIRWSYPLSKGFLEDKRPYLGGSVYCVF